MLTEAILRRLAPRARDDLVKGLLEGGPLFEEYGITTPKRMVAFLGTTMVETGALTLKTESLKYTKQRLIEIFPKRYKNRPDLAAAHAGNERLVGNFNYGFRMGNQRDGLDDDDGFNYRGRGYFQITGQDNYEEAKRLTGIDVVSNPELLNDPKVALEAACAEAAQFHKFADRGEAGFRAYSNGVNRGDPMAKDPPHERLAYYRRAAKLLEVTDTPEDASEYGDTGALIEGYQKRLAELGYHVGAVDGILGSHTRAAILAFQMENGLKPDGRIGPLTRAALNKPDAKAMPVPVARAKATEEDLAKSGSGTILDARTVETAAKTLVVTGAAKGVQDSFDVLGTAQGWVSELGGIRAVVDPAIVLAKWAFQFWWLFAIVAGIIVLQKTDAIKKARVLAHRLGKHIGR
jgi:putative chitinase